MTTFNNLFSLICVLTISTFAFAQPANDSCANAIDLSSSLGQGVDNMINAGTYGNTSATTGNDDPDTGFECFGEPDGYGTAPSLDNTVWFKITGDGNVYYIQATSTDCSVNTGVDNNDTQMAIYTGTCGALSPLSCNEDFAGWSPGDYPAALELVTSAGEEYYILVDGFNFNGAMSEGEFCMFITQQDFVACNNPDISGGTASSPTMIVCEGEMTNIAIEGVIAPNEGTVSGYAWVVSTTDLQGNPDFTSDPGFIGGFPISAEPITPLTFNPSTFAGTSMTGTYYFTMVAFGNATWADPNEQTFITEAVLDPECTTLSNSVQIDYYETALCPETTILSVDESVLGMTIFPNPTQDLLNLNINTADYSEATIIVTNPVGQMMQQQNVNLASGANVFSMNMSQIPAGVKNPSIKNLKFSSNSS